MAKLATPLADGLIGYDYATFKEKFFHITEAEAEAKVQPHGMADDFHRKAVILIGVGRWRCAHAENMSHYEENAQADRQVDNAIACGKEIGLQGRINFGDMAAEPFQHHAGVLDFFVHVVFENGFQLLVTAGVGALAVPVKWPPALP